MVKYATLVIGTLNKFNLFYLQTEAGKGGVWATDGGIDNAEKRQTERRHAEAIYSELHRAPSTRKTQTASHAASRLSFHIVL